MKLQKIPLIEVSGSNYDIGFILGQKLKKQVSKIIKIDQVDFKKKSGKPLSFYINKTKQIIGATEKHFPQYVDELLGMAEGSGIDFNTLFAAGCEDDLVYNCTSVAGFSREGYILGHNEDWLRDHINSLYICRIKQKNKPDSISLSYVGHLPGFSIGLNSASCVYTGNSIHAKGVNKKGIPLQFLIRSFLDVKKYGELIKLYSMRNKMIGENSLVIFKDRIFDAEILPKGYALIKGGNYLAHTNHLISSRVKSQEKCHSRDSAWRLERANELLKNNEFSFELVKKILSDHKHRPFSICCHEFEKKGAEPYSTIGSVIVKVDKKEFYVAHGNPCKAGYKKYKL